MSAQTKILEPINAEELLRGWLMHAHKGRDRHDVAARRYERMRYFLGGPTIVLSAVVGTSVFSALGHSPSFPLQLLVGACGVTAGVLAALQTFLDYPTRVERHRLAGVRYKAVIWELEQMLTGTGRPANPDAPNITTAREHLEALERDMPVVAEGIFDRIETKYRDVAIVHTALALTATVHVKSQP
jgi:hypothetical protein